MISLEKLMILAPLQILLKNVRDSGKLIVAKGLKKLPKVQKIANSGHTSTDKTCGPSRIAEIEPYSKILCSMHSLCFFIKYFYYYYYIEF